MLDEKFARDQIFISQFLFTQHDFFFFWLSLRSFKPIQHFIQHGIFVMLGEM